MKKVVCEQRLMPTACVGEYEAATFVVGNTSISNGITAVAVAASNLGRTGGGGAQPSPSFQESRR
jgi:hypothetical protein